jgi:prophage tail gpP-like protein
MKVLLNNKEYRNFQRYTINRKFNAVASTFQLVTLENIVEDPSAYPQVKIYDEEDALILTGVAFTPDITVSAKSEVIITNGYSITGVLEDCTIPASKYPLQFDNLSLYQITEKLLKPFNLKFTCTDNVLSDLKKKYEKTNAEPGMSVKQYLNDLASQRNIYMTHTIEGELKYTRYEEARAMPEIYFETGNPGLKNVELNVNSQSLHSEITVLKQATIRNPDQAEYTITNPYATAYRPIVKTSHSGDIFDIKKAARNLLSEELENIKILLTVTKYAAPGTIIQLKAPEIGLNKATKLFVNETIVTWSSGEDDVITLLCVVPDVYTEALTIKNIFKEQ